MDRRGNLAVTAGDRTAAAERTIEVRFEDLAFVTADAIAWPVTDELRATTPLLRRLEDAGGPRLRQQLTAQDALAVGSAVVTGAGDLSVELLVSAVVSSASESVSEGGVRRALLSALQRAADWQIEHLACAPFGLGAGNLMLEDSAALMASVAAQHVARMRYPSRITIIVESPLELEVFQSALARAAR
ncbi:MAG TPA: macro domain-containing protein [Gemmatimonadaceae bacterium]|nr:macro domain-containing protein [Gemmatimonadaceae bacterium]